MEQSDFYKTAAWKKCRESYLKKVGYLCERCLKEGKVEPAVVVHHKHYITEENLTNPQITLNHENLEALCWHHHEQEHKGRAKRYLVDAEGRVSGMDTREMQ